MTSGRHTWSGQPRREGLRWPTPREVYVSSDGLWLEWRYDRREGDAATAGGRGRMSDLWEAFLRLEGAEDRELERFARAWGVLHADGAPGVGATGREKLIVWKHFVALFTALERAALAEHISKDDLATIRAALRGSSTWAELAAYVRSPRLELVRAVLDEFLVHPNVRVRALRDRRSPGGLRTALHPNRLLGGLSLALLERIQSGARACRACSTTFIPRRSDERYCDGCDDRKARASERMRQKRRRDRR